MNPKLMHAKILEEYSPFFRQFDTKELEQYSEVGGILSKFSKNENSIKIICDNANYKILAVSNNAEALTGFTQEDIKKSGALLYFRALEFEHILAPYYLGKWGNAIFRHIATLKNINYEKIHITNCGLKMKLKNGKKIRLLARIRPVRVSDVGHLEINIATLEDVSHLLKSDFYWDRISCGEDSHKFFYSSANKKYNYQDILSNREKDVFQLIAQGYESKEIAQKLYISMNTVDNHRRNAIARTGARDTTALIQLAKMSGLF